MERSQDVVLNGTLRQTAIATPRRRGAPVVRRVAQLLLLILVVAVGAMSGLPTPVAEAATFTVTKTTDSNDGACNADCSLREAIVAANALAGADTMTLPAGTYTLTLGALAIFDALTITGAGSATTIIDSNNQDRVIDLAGTTVFAVDISGVTLRKGRA